MNIHACEEIKGKGIIWSWKMLNTGKIFISNHHESITMWFCFYWHMRSLLSKTSLFHFLCFIFQFSSLFNLIHFLFFTKHLSSISHYKTTIFTHLVISFSNTLLWQLNITWRIQRWTVLLSCGYHVTIVTFFYPNLFSFW